MGYESKLVIVKKSHLGADPDCDNKTWAEKIAEVNLSCVGNECAFWNYPPTDCYYYDDEVDHPILKDKYEEELKEIPLDDCITILEDANTKDPYRRYTIALGLLKAFNDNDWCDGDIVVLHYGY